MVVELILMDATGANPAENKYAQYHKKGCQPTILHNLPKSAVPLSTATTAVTKNAAVIHRTILPIPILKGSS